MAITPFYVGQTHVKLSLTWQDDSGTAVDLTGATVTCRFLPVHGAGFAGTGTVNVTNAAGGVFTYAFSAGDVATAGDYTLQFKAVYGDSTVNFADPLGLSILADT